MEKESKNSKSYTFSIKDNDSESQNETSPCHNIEHFYTEQVKSGEPEVNVLIDLALLQYHCTKKLIENQNEELFHAGQQVILQKKIIALVGKVKPRLFKVDEYSATALTLFLSDFNQMILDDQSIFKVNLAQSVAYYLKYLLRDEGNKVRSKRSAESYKGEDIVNPFSKEHVNSRIDYAYAYQLYKESEKALDGIKNAKTLEESRVFIKNFLRFSGELLENKVTISVTEGLNARIVKSLSDLIGPIDSFISFRDLETHGKFSRDIELSEELTNEFADKSLLGIRDASLIIMNKIETKHIAEIFDKYSNEKIKSFLEEKGLSKAKLKELGVAGIKEAINRIRKNKEFLPLQKEGEKIFIEIESRLKEMKTGELQNFNPEETDKSLRKDKRSIGESTKKLSDFVKNENKQTVKYLMEGEEIKKLSKEVATQKLKEFIDYLHPGKLKDNVSELIKKGNYKEVITILSKDIRYKEDVKRIISGTEFREAIKKIAERMVASGIKGNSIIRNYLEKVLSEKELTKGVDVVKGEYLQILIERKNSYIEEIKILNRESIPADVLLSLHDLLTKIDDLQGIYESIDWKSDKGSLERVKEVVERIKEFGKEASYRLETGFENEFDGVKPNKLIGIYESEVNKYKKRGEALGTDLREKIDKMNKIVERTINSVETKFFDKARNSISHIDITQEGEMSDKLKVQKEQALEVFKEVIKREGANTSRLSFEKEIRSIQDNGLKGDSKKKYESFSRLIEGFDICAGSSNKKPISVPGRRKLLAINEKPMFQFSLGKGCFEIEEVEKFAEIDNEYRITSIDSEKIVSSIKETQNKGDIESVHQLVGLADRYEVSGKNRFTLNQLTEMHEQYSKLERLGRISGHINQGLMAKDFIDDLLAGDYKYAAINIAFFAGSHGLSKLASLASMKGTTYMSEEKMLLGKSLKLGAPFVSRMTSAFVAYDLYNQVQEYKKGNKDAIVPIIGDSIQLSVDTLSIGVEVGEWAGLSAFEGISAVFGPVGETIGLLVLMGSKVYSAVRTVEKIDEKIHLTGMERFDEGLRAFFGMNPENSIKVLMEEKELNNQVVRDIISFLKSNPQIKRAIFPSMYVEEINEYTSEVVATCSRVAADIFTLGIAQLPYFNRAFYPKRTIHGISSSNEVFLNQKVSNIKWIRAKPDEPAEGRLFCVPNVMNEEKDYIHSIVDTYRSKDAIGVKYSKDREGKSAFINLTEGKNTIVGFPNKNNIFAIGQGYKNIIGGEGDDLFKFTGKNIHNQSPYIEGIIDGQGGTDTLDIAALPSEINNIVINFQEKNLRDTDNKLSLEVKNINNFIGRAGKIDTVNAACDTRHIDARGGVNDSNYDTITINDNVVCKYDTKVIIRPYTKVDSKPREGVINYIVNEKEVGTANVNIDGNSKSNHLFIFANYTLNDISSIKIQESSISFSFSVSNSKFKLLVNGSPTTYSYQLSSSTKLIVGQKNLYALHNTQEPINSSSIERYSNIAKKLKMNLVVHSNEEALSVGHDHHDVIQNDPTAKVSHLVGNGGENIFILKSEVDIKNLPLADVVLYNFNRREATRDILDLREINKQVKELFKDELTFAVNETGKDLKVTLFTQSYKQIIKIRLKDALENHWYKMLDVLINGVLIIEKTDNGFKLSPKPLIFSDRYKTTYVITPNDVERENSIEIKKSIGNYVFARDDNTLVITNALQSSTDEPSTVLLNNFYINDKMKTLNIKFGDKEVVLAKELNRIMELNNKNDFHDRVEQFRTNGYRSVIDSEIKERIVNAIGKSDCKLVASSIINNPDIAHLRIKDGRAALHLAVLSSNLEIVKCIVNQGTDVNIRDEYGNTSLHLIANGLSIKNSIQFRRPESSHPTSSDDTKKLKIIDYLIKERGARIDLEVKGKKALDVIKNKGYKEEVNSILEFLKNKLFNAANEKDSSTIRKLLLQGTDPNVKNNYGQNLLHVVSRNNDLSLVRYLIERGSNLNVTDKDGNTPLHCAILNNAMSVAIYLLDEGADLHIENKIQKTPLVLLKNKGRLDILSSINRSSNELIVAIREKNINKIKSLFMHVVNVNDKNMYGKTLMHFAVLYGTPEIVRYLADQGADVNIRDKDGYTPLYEATKSNKLDIVNILIEKGAKIDKKVEGKTPMDILKDTGNIHQVRDINIRLEHNLLISLKEGALNKVENLIKQGININCKDSDLRTPLHYASKLGFLEIVRLLVYKGADIDKKDKEGFTPLYLAANNGQLDVVNYLIQKGAKIIVSNSGNVSDIIKNLTKKLEVELVDAVKNNQVEKIRLLINQGVDVNTRNKDSQTLLHIAVENGYLNLVKLLVEHHADCNLPDKYFHTPLYYAVVSRRLDIVEYLIERGSADINISNNDGKTLLHFATLVGDYSIVEYLIKKNISTTSLVDGITPLHIAALTGDMDTIDFLVKKFNINIRDKDNRTPLHYASKWGKIEVVKYLLENKALVDLKDNNNKTPLDYARENGHSEVERYIVNYRPLNKRLQHNSNKDALNLQVKLDYSLQQVKYNNDEPMSKEELTVENLYKAIRNNDKKWLTDHESDLSITGKDGETLLHIVALKGYLDVVKYLVSKRADIYAKDNTGKTVMHYAARGGNIEVIKYLIDKDIEIDTKSKEGKTPLQSAASAGHLEAMIYLTSQGADLYAINRDQVTTQHYAVEGNNEEVIEYLLKKGFDINAATHRGKTPIHYAAQKGSLEIIKYLVEHGADVSVKGSFGNTVLHYAAERGDVEIVSYLLKQGIDINTQNHLGNTPLNSASIKGNLDVVSYLRKSGADIDIENRNGEKAKDILKKKGLVSDKVVSRGKYTNLDELVENLFDSIIRKDNSLFVDKNDILKIQDQSGRTLLHAAASKGYMVVVRYLIESAGAEVDSIDSLGQTPLYSAIFNDKLEVVKYLVEECRANISLKDNNQETPLHFAVLNSRVLIVKYLLEQGAQVNAKDHDERTPLHLAIYHNKQELAKYLIVKGKANVNAFDINGNTPMHYSSMKGNLNMIQYLVNKGADIYEENNEGKTPLDMLREKGYEIADIIKQFQLNVTMIDAVKHNDIKKVQELIDKGANINIRDKLGQTLINHAVSNNYVNMARYLVNHGADIYPAGGFCPMVSEGNVVSIEPCATNGATSSLVSKVVSRVKRSISGFFGDSTDMNANVNSSQSIETQNYAAPIKTGRDIPRIDMNNGYGKTVTENIDVNGNLLLLNVLVRKVTGEKFVPCTSSIQSISEREAMACAMSITHEFEKALKKAANASKTKITQDKLGHQLYINVHPIVTASMVKGEYDKIENILHSAAKYICPEGNKNFVKLINIEIKNMLTRTNSKVSTIQEDKPSYGEGQPSSLINQINAQSINQRRLIA